MDNFLIAEKVCGLAEKPVKAKNLELVHVEIFGPKSKPTVRVFIDSPDGITHDHCSDVSAVVGEILDSEDFISSRYVLEVSSPGIERGLYSLRDFEKFAGSLAKVKTRSPVEGQRNFRGTIKGVENEEIYFEDRSSGTVKFSFSDVAKANLEVDISKELGGKN